MGIGPIGLLGCDNCIVNGFIRSSLSPKAIMLQDVYPERSLVVISNVAGITVTAVTAVAPPEDSELTM